MTIDPRVAISELVLEHPGYAAVFARHRIDFCCGGRIGLEEACARKGLALPALVAELERSSSVWDGQQEHDPRQMSTPELLKHIVERNHLSLRQALPFIEGLSIKVARVHGDHNPRLQELQESVQELSAELLPHLDEEEKSLFPALCAAPPDGPALAKRLLAMRQEHHRVGQLLHRIRSAAEDFSMPAWACTSYRTLFKELKVLESDVMRQVHLENWVLAPRFT